MVMLKLVKNLWNNSVRFWNNCKFWNIPNVNYSRIIPRIIPGIWNNWNYSKNFELFQTAKNSGFQRGLNYSRNYSSRVRVRAIILARVISWNNISLKGYILFQRNKGKKSLEGLQLFQNSKRKITTLRAYSYGALAVIFPQGIF